MVFAGPRILRARAQGLTAVVAAATLAVVMGGALGHELIGVPGLVEPIPAVRVFPALVAAIGSLVLFEPWREFEAAGARPVWVHRGYRYALGLVIVVATGAALSVNARTVTILVLATLLYAALALTVGLMGRHWWIVVLGALYAQIFVQQYEDFQPGLGWAVLAAAVVCPAYLARGEAVLGRSRFDRSPP